MPAAEFTVQDGKRTIQFTGHLLATASSAMPGKTRWVEFMAFRTQGGMYILYGIGRSKRENEVDRHWVRQAEEPSGLIEALYMMGDEGQRYLPRTAQSLLEDASELDPALARAYRCERIA